MKSLSKRPLADARGWSGNSWCGFAVPTAEAVG
jgi:hypothetical protein